jgi:RimJ/RimL family protein N-acetyltransferase
VPELLESDITLKDGSGVHIRQICPEDEQRLVEFSRILSPQSAYQRFFTALPELSPGMARYLSNLNTSNRLALVAEAGSKLVGVARYERTPEPDLVELGLVILDEWQNRGLGRILLRAILRAGEANGIARFRADVLAENRRMLRLLATEARIMERKTEAGITSLILTAHSACTRHLPPS